MRISSTSACVTPARTKVFRFCKEALSPSVTLRHDYLVRMDTVQYEFIIYVHHYELKLRAVLQT